MSMLPARCCSVGFYLNELLLKRLARHDPHPALFDAYAADAAAAGRLADELPGIGAARLRAGLLREIGCCPTWRWRRDAAAAEVPAQPAMRAGGRRGRQAAAGWPRLGVLVAAGRAGARRLGRCCATPARRSPAPRSCCALLHYHLG